MSSQGNGIQTDIGENTGHDIICHDPQASFQPLQLSYGKRLEYIKYAKEDKTCQQMQNDRFMPYKCYEHACYFVYNYKRRVFDMKYAACHICCYNACYNKKNGANQLKCQAVLKQDVSCAPKYE